MNFFPRALRSFENTLLKKKKKTNNGTTVQSKRHRVNEKKIKIESRNNGHLRLYIIYIVTRSCLYYCVLLK